METTKNERAAVFIQWARSVYKARKTDRMFYRAAPEETRFSITDPVKDGIDDDDACALPGEPLEVRLLALCFAAAMAETGDL